ncbi:multiple C2 and transmembrane domain-containing protein 2-like [Mustela nigripes]|uniref:multiple C2 and transmembrane domain-containing protein 2-like n=1 Tax=Mustela nigripes TaxID=77151 RepID=UPI002815797B|nr:multiple C2 and transmembrane domain-containing protein 2-like [Mustela nigripes]
MVFSRSRCGCFPHRGALSWSDFLGLQAAMEDKPSVWGSLKQWTRPLLINLSKRRVKKNPNKPLDLRARRSLDRRLSLSVPDLLEAEALAPEGRPYSGPQSLYTSVPSSLLMAGILPKSSSSSLKQSVEELDWSQEEAGYLRVVETDSEEAYASPAEDRRPSSNGILDLLQKTPAGDEALEEPEVRPGLGTFLLLLLFFSFLCVLLALGRFGLELFLWFSWMERMSFIRI